MRTWRWASETFPASATVRTTPRAFIRIDRLRSAAMRVSAIHRSAFGTIKQHARGCRCLAASSVKIMTCPRRPDLRERPQPFRRELLQRGNFFATTNPRLVFGLRSPGDPTAEVTFNAQSAGRRARRSGSDKNLQKNPSVSQVPQLREEWDRETDNQSGCPRGLLESYEGRSLVQPVRR